MLRCLMAAALVPASLLVPLAWGAPSPSTTISARSYSGPTATRVVFEFSRPVAHVAPDSGVARRVLVALPGESIVLGPGASARLAPRDGVVDSIVIEPGPSAARLQAFLADSTGFTLFSLPAQDDKPYRLVLDVAKRGGEAAQEQRLAKVAARKRNDRVRVVAVDAGHGGEDNGAHGPHGVLEKHVTLAVARALVNELNHIPGIRGVMVRDGDYFIPLRDRYRAAEKMKADLFISIHCNSSRRRGKGNGTEVYFLSLRGAEDQASKDLASSENAADLIGGVPAQSEDELVNILYDVKRSSALQSSQLLAETLLDHLTLGVTLESRGIKQAGFVVLKSVEFPSVLVETAFINNPHEARLLNSRDFQQRLGRDIATGVKSYFERAGIGLGGSVPSGSDSNRN